MFCMQLKLFYFSWYSAVSKENYLLDFIFQKAMFTQKSLILIKMKIIISTH